MNEQVGMSIQEKVCKQDQCGTPTNALGIHSNMYV